MCERALCVECQIGKREEECSGVAGTTKERHEQGDGNKLTLVMRVNYHTYTVERTSLVSL